MPASPSPGSTAGPAGAAGGEFCERNGDGGGDLSVFVGVGIYCGAGGGKWVVVIGVAFG